MSARDFVTVSASPRSISAKDSFVAGSEMSSDAIPASRASTVMADRFSSGVADRYSSGVADQFSSGVADWFSSGVADQFSLGVANWFSLGVADQFSSGVADWFTSGVADQFSSGVADWFSSGVADWFSSGVADQFSSGVADCRLFFCSTALLLRRSHLGNDDDVVIKCNRSSLSPNHRQTCYNRRLILCTTCDRLQCMDFWYAAGNLQ